MNGQAKNLISGKILFNESNVKSQIFVYHQTLNEESMPIMIIAGFADNSVKILKDFKISETLNFHSVILFSFNMD